MFPNQQLCGWEHFLKAMIVHFGSQSLEAPESLLAKLQMTSFVQEHLSRFEKLANRTTDVSPPLMKHMFTSGLHPSIKADVLSFTPVDIHDAIRLAFLQEQRVWASPSR